MPITTRHWRRIEAPRGVGKIRDGDRHVATVTYALRVFQEVIGTRHWTGSRAVQGTRQISGGFHVVRGSLPFDGDQLTLTLDDGRSLRCFIAGAGPEYTIDPAGALS